MIASPSDDLLGLCRQALETLAEGARVSLSSSEIAELAQDLQTRARRRGISSPDQIAELAKNFIADGAIVKAMLDERHPAHQQGWEQAHATIMRWLHARGYYPRDDVGLDERAPDVAALADLKRALPAFDHAAQLETFIIALAKRRTDMWLRDQAASKRGGEGVFTRARRQQRRPEGPARRRDQIQYLSQLAAEEGLSVEELVGTSGIDIPDLVEQRDLLRLVVREAHALARDEQNDLILKVWYAAFIEGHSYSDIAGRFGLKQSQVAALFRQFKARLQAALRAWVQDEE
jgi:hypothetical protein